MLVNKCWVSHSILNKKGKVFHPSLFHSSFARMKAMNTIFAVSCQMAQLPDH